MPYRKPLAPSNTRHTENKEPARVSSNPQILFFNTRIRDHKSLSTSLRCSYSRQMPPMAPIIAQASTGSTSSIDVYSNLLMDMSNERKENSISLEDPAQYQFCFAVVVDYVGKTQNRRVPRVGRRRESRSKTNIFVPRLRDSVPATCWRQSASGVTSKMVKYYTQVPFSQIHWYMLLTTTPSYRQLYFGIA